MKPYKIILISLLALFVVSSAAIAGEFGWVKDFNIQAQADPSGFKTRLATRFKIGEAMVTAVLSNFDSPADAYIGLRLGEISGRTTDYVIDKYKQDKGRGWGRVAKSLGIKPGSAEFHALKQRQDLYGGGAYGQAYGSGPGHGKNKGKGKGPK